MWAAVRGLMSVDLFDDCMSAITTQTRNGTVCVCVSGPPDQDSSTIKNCCVFKLIKIQMLHER